MTGTVLDSYPLPPCAALLGFQYLDHDADKGWARIAFEAKADFCNPAGFVQGGFLAAMLDDTMGPALLLATDGALYPTTITMTVNYLAPARPGRIIGEGHVIRSGKTIAFLEASLADERGTFLARASATARLVAMQAISGQSACRAIC